MIFQTLWNAVFIKLAQHFYHFGIDKLDVRFLKLFVIIDACQRMLIFPLSRLIHLVFDQFLRVGAWKLILGWFRWRTYLLEASLNDVNLIFVCNFICKSQLIAIWFTDRHIFFLFHLTLGKWKQIAFVLFELRLVIEVIWLILLKSKERYFILFLLTIALSLITC